MRTIAYLGGLVVNLRERIDSTMRQNLVLVGIVESNEGQSTIVIQNHNVAVLLLVSPYTVTGFDTYAIFLS